MRYGATDEPAAEEMLGVTDDDVDIKERKRKQKSGMKPGQALSFSGLEPRSHTGADMLDMQQVQSAYRSLPVRTATFIGSMRPAIV
jgi:hypothetical protein